MSSWTIDTAKTIEASQEIVDIAIRLDTIKSSIAMVEIESFWSNRYGSNIEYSIKSIMDSVAAEAASMRSLGEALHIIANKYRETENDICSAIGFEDPSDRNQQVSSKEGTDKRNLWQKFWDWIRKKSPDEYKTTSHEQEKAADAAMKKKLWKTLQNEKYSQDNWDKASVEERKKILQDYMNEVIIIYGLKDVNKEIRWDQNATYTDSSITWGYYSQRNHKVTLNEQALTDSCGNWDSYDLLETVSHELRHAYQHEAIKHPTEYMVSQETIDIWRDNFDNYIDSDDDYRGYRAQPVEVDARDFQVNRDMKM